MMTRVFVNGCGRIGRRVIHLIQENKNIQLVGLNDLTDSNTIAHLLKYDSVHGVSKNSFKAKEDKIIINDKEIPYYSETSPSNIPYDEIDVDIVIESTGKFRTKELAQQHIDAGAKKVILSAPAQDKEIPFIVLGINEDLVDLSQNIISNASCTTNCAAPMVKVIEDLCGIESAYITTIHSYTSDQRLHDAPHSDLRRARAATESIIPTSTGAAKAITKIFPNLKEKIGGCGIRVPVPNGSLTDITFVVKKNTSFDEVNKAFKEASEIHLKNILEYTTDPIVSKDIIGNPKSCIFDANLTSVIDKMVKVVGWYDNENGYSNRLIDLITLISNQK